MNYFFYKFAIIFLINISISQSVYAKTVEQSKLDFPIKSHELINGEIHYFFKVLSLSELSSLKNRLIDFDTIGIFKEPDTLIELGKSVYVVNRPVGFFDDKQLTELKYLSYIMKGNKLKDKGEGIIEVTHKNNKDHTYDMRSYFDADDISTLPSSKIGRAVQAAKELDTLSKSASTIMVT